MSRNNRSNNSQQVAVLEQPRMQMPAHVAEEYDLNQDSWRALTDAVFPGAKTVGAVILALAYCKKHHLDIFQKVVHIVPIYMNGKTVESVWPGIGQLRVIAQRQEAFAGYDDCEFGPTIEHTFTGYIEKWSDNGQGGRSKTGSEKVEVTMSFPEWAQFTVYKMLHGQRVPLKGPKVYFLETYAWKTGKCAVPNEMWEKRPNGQLEKCAEAAAWRRAFPDVLGNEYAMEEMAGRNVREGTIEGQYVEVDDKPRKESTATRSKPKRSDYQPSEQRRDETDQRRAESEPANDDPTAALDDPNLMPSGDKQWRTCADMILERLGRCENVDEVDALQEAQQFRIDAAPPAIAAELMDEINSAAARLEEAPAGDDAGGDDEGSTDEETTD